MMIASLTLHLTVDSVSIIDSQLQHRPVHPVPLPSPRLRLLPRWIRGLTCDLDLLSNALSQLHLHLPRLRLAS